MTITTGPVSSRSHAMAVREWSSTILNRAVSSMQTDRIGIPGPSADHLGHGSASDLEGVEDVVPRWAGACTSPERLHAYIRDLPLDCEEVYAIKRSCSLAPSKHQA